MSVNRSWRRAAASMDRGGASGLFRGGTRGTRIGARTRARRVRGAYQPRRLTPPIGVLPVELQPVAIRIEKIHAFVPSAGVSLEIVQLRAELEQPLVQRIQGVRPPLELHGQVIEAMPLAVVLRRAANLEEPDVMM